MINCVEGLFKIKKNDSVGFSMINITRLSVSGFKEVRNS